MNVLTPMMAQYMKIKEEYPDCILFYRLGDFYEMFFDDAIKAAKILDITLTSRNKKGKGKPIPMCGIPFHSSDSYIVKLVNNGLKVAICEQTSNPNSKGIVEREVVKIITPSTLCNYAENHDLSNNLVSIGRSNSSFELAVCDLSTASFDELTFKSFENLVDQTLKLSPKEVIISAEIFEDASKFFLNYPNILLHSFPNSATENLFFYLESTQKQKLNFLEISKRNQTKYLDLDSHTLKNLEVFTSYSGDKKHSLFYRLKHTRTTLGSRLLQSNLLNPSRDYPFLNSRLDLVSQLIDKASELDKIQNSLSYVSDLERIISKIHLKTALPRDLIALKTTLSQIPVLSNSLNLFSQDLITLSAFPGLQKLLEDSILDEPASILSTGGYIKPNFNQELLSLTEFHKNSKSILLELQKVETQKSGITNLKVKFNRVFGYYFEVSNSQISKVPDYFIRKQTLANAERFITPELKELEEKILNANSQIVDLEQRIFEVVIEQIKPFSRTLLDLAKNIAHLDLLCSFAELAQHNNYCRPEFTHSNLVVSQGRHPIVESVLDSPFIPNDTTLSNDNKFHLITGPNMGGKSTYLRQIAIIVYLAHLGCFVPAKQAKIPQIDAIFTRIGASDSLSSGQSTFMLEMSETSDILKKATSKSLIILDELGRGTSTYDGLSIAWAVTKYIHDNLQSYTLFATHYHELIELVEKLEFAKNYSVAVQEKSQHEITFLYKIIPGAINKSYGIHVAKLAALPDNVITLAKETLHRLESENHNLKEPSQLNIFSAPKSENLIEKELKNFDLNNSTPLQAFNFLAHLKDKI